MIFVLLEGSIDTMDVLQETNMAILRNAHLYDPSRPALPWFKAFAMNQVLYYRRTRHDSKLVFNTDMVNEFAAVLTEVESSDRGRDPLDLLEMCLKKLKPWQRELLLERYQNKRKVNEMARKRRVSRVSLSVMMFRLRQALKSCMEGVAYDRSVQGSDEVDREFVEQLETLLDSVASRDEHVSLSEKMCSRPALKQVYVSHARLHALLLSGSDKLFADQLDSVAGAGSSMRFKKVLAYVAATAAAFVLWVVISALFAGSSAGLIQVETYGDDEAWLAQLTPLDMQAYRENMGFDVSQGELNPLQKYEPGSIPNPGAGIEIIEMDLGDGGRHLLTAGDRVWRESLKLESGRLAFRLETGVEITLLGPAELQLHDSGSATLVSGRLVAECREQPLLVVAPGVAVQNRNVAFYVNAVEKKQLADVIVLSGTLQAAFTECGRLGHLAAGEGVRVVKLWDMMRFRCLASESELKDRLFAGKSGINVRNRRKS